MRGQDCSEIRIWKLEYLSDAAAPQISLSLRAKIPADKNEPGWLPSGIGDLPMVCDKSVLAARLDDLTTTKSFVCFFDLDANKRLCTKSYKELVVCVKVTADQRKAAVGVHRNVIEIVRIDSGEILFRMKGEERTPRLPMM